MSNRRGIYRISELSNRGNDNYMEEVPILQWESENSPKAPTSVAYTVCFYIFAILFYSIVAFAVGFAHITLPSPSNLETAVDQFSEARAMVHLDYLVNNIGVRFSGTENIFLAQSYIVNQLHSLGNVGTPSTSLEISVQTASGAFILNKKLSSYSNITNIVVRIAQTGTPYHAPSLLLSAHYDTALFSYGAGDDTTAIAAMIEVIRALYQSPHPPPSPVIFNLNDAEEMGLCGSHAFITQHPWAPGVRAFVNVEGMGAGGRPMLFQSGPQHPYLAEIYRKAAKFPFGSVVGQDIFQSGVIPSETDFRIYRDFGGLPGLDFAFIKNGFVYHTKNDNLTAVPRGTLQNIGDILLNLAREISVASELKSSPPPNITYTLIAPPTPSSRNENTAVFYDFVGIMFFAYPLKVATIVHSITIALHLAAFIGYVVYRLKKNGSKQFNLLTLLKQSILSFIILIVIQIFGIALPVGMSFAFAIIRPNFWYANSSLAYIVYGSWTLLGILFINWVFSTIIQRRWKRFSSSLSTYLYWSAIFEWLLILLLCTSTQIPSGFLAFWWCVWPSVIYMLTTLVQYILERNQIALCDVKFGSEDSELHWDSGRPIICGKVWWWGCESAEVRPVHFNQLWYVIPVLGFLPPSILTLSSLNEFIAVMIPISGRSGVAMAADPIIAILVSVTLVLLLLVPISYIHNAERIGKMVLIMLAICVLLIIPVLTVFPYTVHAPAKVSISQYYNSTSLESYALVAPLSRDSRIVTDGVHKVELARNAYDLGQWTWSVSAPPPNVTFPTISLLSNYSTPSSTTLQLEITAKDALIWRLNISGNIKLLNWGIGDSNGTYAFGDSIKFNDGNYILIHVVGTPALSSKSTVSLSISGTPSSILNKVHIKLTAGYYQISPVLQNLFSELQDWVTPFATSLSTQVGVEYTF